jgi:hypothetical protein
MFMFDREDGLDSFGNVGAARLPAHYTQGRLIGQQTGANNPFGAARAGGGQQQQQQQQQQQPNTGNLLDF